MVSILGKSGCGKSTLLHCLGLIEKPDSGSICYGEKEITNLSPKNKRNYLNKVVSFVFQHYQLVEDQSMLFNASLPLLISGTKEKIANETAMDLLNRVGFESTELLKDVKDCSGGEKQRIAIVRAIINEPRIILADEPTGALDSKNSEIVMKILKKYSEKHLVIMVTHNNELANKFSDRIITLQDGRVIKDLKISEPHKEIFESKNRRIGITPKWCDKVIDINLKKRLRRNVLCTSSLVLSLIFGYLIIGFIEGSKKEINKQALKHFDLGVSNISKTFVQEIENSKLKLIQQRRLNQNEIETLISSNTLFEYGNNYEYLVPSGIPMRIGNKNLEGFLYNPVYEFSNKYLPDLIMEGVMPRDSIYGIAINKQAGQKIQEITGKTPLNQTISINFTREITTYLNNEITPYIIDYFSYSVDAVIKCVIDEFDFLATPTIYYSYFALDEYLSNYNMSNLSKYVGYNTSYKDKISFCSNSDELSSYSYKLFLKDIKTFNEFLNYKSEDFEITNNALVVKEALESFIQASTIGLEMFLIITLLCSFLILGITSFSAYSQDRHQNAILLTFGANQNDIFSVYVFESLMIGTLSFLISSGFSLILQKPVNILIKNIFNFENIVQIPFKSYNGKPFFIPIIVGIITLITCVLFCYMPMIASKKISISKELKEE